MMAIDGFSVGERVVRRGSVAPVGEIVWLIPAVEGRGYRDHKAIARVRFPDRSRLGGSGYRHSNIQLARLQHAQAATTVA